jgi:rhodanese-related sulfurtransferase
MPQQCDWDISVEDLKALLDRDAKFEFIDVREEGEFAVRMRSRSCVRTVS